MRVTVAILDSRCLDFLLAAFGGLLVQLGVYEILVVVFRRVTAVYRGRGRLVSLVETTSVIAY